MQYKIFAISCAGDAEREEEMNLFLRQRRIVAVSREVATLPEGAFWTFCVEYLDGPPVSSGTSFSSGKRNAPKIDYREVLSEEDFIVYAKLRDWRKETALREAVPVYAICTNEQLAAMAQKRCATRADLLSIAGFGEGKAERYGNEILATLQKRDSNGENRCDEPEA